MLSALTVAIVTVASAYAGSVNPQSWALPSVLAMIFPAMLLLTVILIIVNLFICRKAAIVGVASLLCCLSPALDVCPLNFSEPAADSEPLTLLTYNVMQLTDFISTSVSDSPNPTLRMLASSEADIIALQECYDIASIAISEANRPLLDSISRHYPYRSYGARGQSLLSRFPFDEIILSRPNADDFRVRGLPHLHRNRHNHTVRRTPAVDRTHTDDKQLYRDLTRGDTQSRHQRRNTRDPLRPHIQTHRSVSRKSPADRRADRHDSRNRRQMHRLRRLQRRSRMLCPQIARLHRTARRMAAIGSDRHHLPRQWLYFRIDHILYSPQLITPLRTRRLTWPYSDHYPVEMTFTLDNHASPQD